jgi:hypothetical protein
MKKVILWAVGILFIFIRYNQPHVSNVQNERSLLNLLEYWLWSKQRGGS